MADKFGVLKTIIGEELYNKVLDAVGQKEGEAAKAEMTAKEAKEAETTEKAMSAADDEKAEIDPKTGKPKKPKNAAEAAEETAEAKKEAGDESDDALVAIFTKVVADVQAPLLARLDAMETSQAQAKKEYDEQFSKRFGAIEASIKEATDGVSELLGDMPKGVKRASEAAKTATEKAKTLGEKAGPAQDPEHFDFFRDFLMKQE